MTVTKQAHSGAYVVSDLVDGYLVTRTYYGFTKREAVRMFREETR